MINCIPTARSRSALSRRTRCHYLNRSLLEALEIRQLLTTVLPANQYMYHNDQNSTGDNLAETVLTPANVNTADFGLVARATLDGQIYAQPLAVSNVNITRGASQGIHNIIYTATQNDSLYAIDANTGAILWQDSFLNIADPTSLSATAGVTVIPAGGSTSTPTFPFNALVNGADIGPELGILATPVINPATNVMYLVTYTMEKRQGSTPFASSANPSGSAGFDTHYVQRLWAINLANGAVAINPTNPAIEPPSGGQVMGDTILNSTSFSSYTGYKYVAGPFIQGSGDNGTFSPGTGGSAQRDGWVVNSTDASTPWGTQGKTPQGTGYIAFNALLQMGRTALTLLNGNIYMGFASHGDEGPYYGWILGFNAATLANNAAFVTGPTFESFATVSGDRASFDSQAGIWMSGGSIVTDGTYLYMTTGNGAFNINASNFNSSFTTTDNGNVVQLPIDGDYGDAILKIAIDPAANQNSFSLTSPPSTFNPDGQNQNGYGLKIADFFVPSNALYMNFKDEDLGSGGVLLVPDNITSTVPGHVGDPMLVTGGKEGRIYLVDRDNMGGFNTSYPSTTDASGNPTISADPSQFDRVLGEYSVNGIDVQSNQFYSSASYVDDGTNSLFYEALAGKPIWQFNTSSFQAAQSPPNSASANVPMKSSSITFPKRGATLSVSANGASNIILWGLNVNLASTDNLVAYSENLGTAIYSSNTNAADKLAGTAIGATGVKFTSPTVINGLVYAASGGNSGSTAFAEGTIAIYGLRSSYLTSNSTLFSAPSNMNTTRTGAGVQLNWTLHSSAEAEVEVDRSTDGANWSVLTYLANGSNALLDSSGQLQQQYFYRVRAVNGPSLTAFANTATAPAVLLGDANVDGHVDATDISIVLNNFGSSTQQWTSGNFAGTSTVGLTDLADVLNNLGTSAPITGVALPDPTPPADTDTSTGSSTSDTVAITTFDATPSATPTVTTDVTPVTVPAPTIASVSTPVVTPATTPAPTPAAAPVVVTSTTVPATTPKTPVKITPVTHSNKHVPPAPHGRGNAHTTSSGHTVGSAKNHLPTDTALQLVADLSTTSSRNSQHAANGRSHA